MSIVNTYDPKAVTVVVGGIPLSGFADDTFVEIEALADDVTSKSGADGEVGRALNSDSRHSVTITLMQTSKGNLTLTTLRALDRGTSGGAVFPVQVTDLSGLSLFMAAEAWIAKAPTQTYGIEVGDREWTIHTGAPSTNVIGGNN